jgi:DNA-binding IclR family transcriptional regulator
MRNEGETAVRNGLPVIDRVSDMLDLLERRPAGMTIRDLSQSLSLPRSSVYRSLNTLEAHGLVRRSPAGAYRLGMRFLALAAQVVVDPVERGLVALAQPHLEQLSRATGEASKISVLAGDRALVVAAAQARGSVGVAVVPGKSYPLHAGGASKLLLAHLPPGEIDRHLHAGLPAITRRTVTDREMLKAELEEIRRRGWAQDRGEYSASVHAIAAPLRDRAGRVVAALSVPFLADADARRRVRLREAVTGAAARISAALAAAEP